MTIYDELYKPKELPASYIDRSDLEAFATCPQQGQLRKTNPTETNEVLPVVGQFVHKLAEEAIKFCDGNLQEASDYFAEELSKSRPDLQPEIIRAGRHLANQLLRFQSNKVLLCEEQITRAIIPATKEKGEVLITTKPDLVLATTSASTLIVLDYKSGWRDRTNYDAADEFQTCVICWCLRAKYPDVKTVHFTYLNTRKGTQAYARIEFDKVIGINGLTQELAFGARILEAVKTWQYGIDAAWPEPSKCSMCPVMQWCKYADPSVPMDYAKNPKEYLDRFVVLSEGLARMERVLTDAAKTGRCIYGTETYFDDSLKKKSPFRASLKTTKKVKDENEKD